MRKKRPQFQQFGDLAMCYRLALIGQNGAAPPKMRGLRLANAAQLVATAYINQLDLLCGNHCRPQRHLQTTAASRLAYGVGVNSLTKQNHFYGAEYNRKIQ